MPRRHGLKTTAHAGEFGCAWTHVRTAVEVLQVDRIDHGYTVIDEPAYARQLAERGLVFTVVPTNSYYLRALPRERWALDHPIRSLQCGQSTPLQCIHAWTGALSQASWRSKRGNASRNRTCGSRR